MKKRSSQSIALAWGVACIVRENINRARLSIWPVATLTHQEQRIVARAEGYLEAAHNELCKLQSSLSERTKWAGGDRPSTGEARAWLDDVRAQR